MDDFYKILAIRGEEVVETPLMKEKEKVFVSHLEISRRRFKSRDNSRDVAKEMAEAVRGNDEEGALRRSSLTMCSSTNIGVRAVGQETAAPPDVPRTGDLELIPVAQVERLDSVAANSVRGRRASTPLETVGKGEDSTMMEESTLVEEGEG